MDSDSKFWKLFTQISSFILVVGIIKIIIFYQAFGIPAQYFTSVSELGVLVSNNLLYISTVLLFGFMVGNISIYNTRKNDNKIFSIDDDEQLKIALKKKEKSDSVFLNVIKFIFYYLIPIGTALVFFIFPRYEVFVGCVSIYITSFYFFISIKYHDFTMDLVKSIYWGKIFLMLCFGCTGMGLITAFEIHEIKSGKYKGTVIHLTDSTNISTSDSVVFVGKTENYVFLYNLNSKTSEIYPTSEVKKITLKQNPAW